MIKAHVPYILVVKEYRNVVPTMKKAKIDALVSITYRFELVSITYVYVRMTYVYVRMTYVLVSIVYVLVSITCVGEYSMCW